MNLSLCSKSRGRKRELNPAWKHDIAIGTTFGRWIVVDVAPGYKTNHQSRWLCRCVCGIERIVASSALRKGVSRSCGCLRNEKSSQRAKGRLKGRKSSKDGYVFIFVDGRYRREHVVVMERLIGRPLYPDETVHHKNGIRNDNSPNNLEIRVRAKHPKGGTISDLLSWADELIARYRMRNTNGN